MSPPPPVVSDIGELYMTAPSASRIVRSHLTVDVADARWHAQRLAFADVVLYCWAGSSLQAGADWLVPSYLWARGLDLVNICGLAQMLFKIARCLAEVFRSADTTDRDEELRRIAQHRDTLGLALRQKLHFHKQPLVAIGHLASGLESKTKAFFHALLMESAN